MSNTKEQISRCMRANKSSDTIPELLLRKELWKRGLRYRKNYRRVAGKPDIVFVKAKIAVFVDGAFWHGYDWDRRRDDIKSNREYWINKIERNMERDIQINGTLKESGWTVLRFWDFEVKNDVKACGDKIEQAYRDKRREPSYDTF